MSLGRYSTESRNKVYLVSLLKNDQLLLNNILSDKASLIPKINLKKMSKVIGKDTKSAVRSGFFWSYAGLIDNVVNLIKKETKKSKSKSEMEEKSFFKDAEDYEDTVEDNGDSDWDKYKKGTTKGL